MTRRLAGFLLAAIFAPALPAQLVVKLSPRTLAEFEKYTRTVRSSLEQRWSGHKPFLYLDELPAEKQSVLNGEIFVQQMNNGQPVTIPDGLIHDWIGAVYIPNKPPEPVIQLLEDFDRHHETYPAISKSHLIRRDGHHVTGYWQLQQKGIVPVVLNVEEEAAYKPISPGKWKGEACSRSIQEINTGLFSSGKPFPADEGYGYLWRLYSFWTLESFEHGTLAECRTLSLTRDIPPALNWAVSPYVQKMPRQSLESTLRETRAALEK